MLSQFKNRSILGLNSIWLNFFLRTRTTERYIVQQLTLQAKYYFGLCSVCWCYGIQVQGLVCIVIKLVQKGGSGKNICESQTEMDITRWVSKLSDWLHAHWKFYKIQLYACYFWVTFKLPNKWHSEMMKEMGKVQIFCHFKNSTSQMFTSKF